MPVQETPPPARDPQVPPQTVEERPARTKRITRWVSVGVSAVLGVLVLLIAVGKFVGRNDLPGCDSQRAWDTLSTVFKREGVQATGYDERRTVSSSADEVVCAARLTVSGNSHIAVDYRFFREGDQQRIAYTIRRE